MLDVDPIEAHVQKLRPRAFVLDHVDAHGFTIHHDAVRQAIREARQSVVARLQVAVGPLAGEHDGHAEGARDGDSEAGQRQIESVHQLDAMAADILSHLPRALESVECHEGAHGQRQNRNAGLAKFFGAEAIFEKAADVRFKFGFVEGLRELGHLAFTAA